MPRQPKSKPAPRISFPSELLDAICIDSETTGLNFRKPFDGFKFAALPFAFTACSCQDGTQWYWDFPVVPKTRGVIYNRRDIADIRDVLFHYKYWVFHNAIHDLRSLVAAGVLKWSEVDWTRVHDTHPASHVLDSTDPHDLKSLGIKYLDILDDDQKILQSRVREHHDVRRKLLKHIEKHGRLPQTISKREAILLETPLAPEPGADYWLPKHVDPSDTSCKVYCMNDGLRGALLWRLHVKQLHNPDLADSNGRLPWHHYIRERNLLPITMAMEDEGISLNPKRFKANFKLYSSTQAEKEKQLQKIAGKYGFPDLNLRSTKQLGEFLYTDKGLGLPPLVWTKGGEKSPPKPSTAAEAIEEVSYFVSHNPKLIRNPKDATKFFDILSEHRGVTSALTYLEQYDAYRVNFQLHSSFNQNGTATTRYSSSSPNLMNIGGESSELEIDDYTVRIRDSFGPRRGRVWLCIDFSQLELRLLAKASGDPSLSDILNKGVDRHQLTCDAINAIRSSMGLAPISRKIAKNINFAWGYGAGDNKLSMMAGIPAAEFNLAMRTAYPGVVAFMDDCSKFAAKHGYIETMFGYRLYVPRPIGRTSYWYKATNYRIQGTAGELAKNAMLNVSLYLSDHKRLRSSSALADTRLILQIHDELVFDAPSSITKKEVSNLASLISSVGNEIACPTPVEAAVCKTSWGQPQKWNLN